MRVLRIDGPATTLLLELDDGTGTLVPVLPDFLAALTFDDGELIDVSYEPSFYSWRHGDYVKSGEYIRRLRAIAAGSSLHGRFRLEGGDAEQVARKMQIMKGVDPTLSVYAAYAFHDMQLLEPLKSMREFQRNDLGATLFDLELTSRALTKRRIEPNMNVVPFAPLLAQGWALVRKGRVALAPQLESIERRLLDSLWSLYDAEGVAMLRETTNSQDVR